MRLLENKLALLGVGGKNHLRNFSEHLFLCGLVFFRSEGELISSRGALERNLGLEAKIEIARGETESNEVAVVNLCLIRTLLENLESISHLVPHIIHHARDGLVTDGLEDIFESLLVGIIAFGPCFLLVLLFGLFLFGIFLLGLCLLLEDGFDTFNRRENRSPQFHKGRNIDGIVTLFDKSLGNALGSHGFHGLGILCGSLLCSHDISLFHEWFTVERKTLFLSFLI